MKVTAQVACQTGREFENDFVGVVLAGLVGELVLAGAGPGEESEACILKSKYHGHTVETAFEWRNKEKSMEEISIGLT